MEGPTGGHYGVRYRCLQKKRPLSILLGPKNVNVGLWDFRNCPNPGLGKILGFGTKWFHKKSTWIASVDGLCPKRRHTLFERSDYRHLRILWTRVSDLLQRLADSIEISLQLSDGLLYVLDVDSNKKEVRSINKNIRSSVRKLNPILKSLVGKKVEIAIRNLSFSEKRITKDIKKTISSAIANAENNFQYDIDKLFIKEAYCGKQVIMKRFRARAKGRAAPILKPYSNLTIILSEKQNKEVKHGPKS